MLSICIPQYNFNINPLVKSLTDQITHLKTNIEIIIIDDCSTIKYPIEINPEIVTKHITLTENIGRARIRNLFINIAEHDYMLFLDCDSLIIKDDFLTQYLDEIAKKKYLVICGGRTYPDKLPSRSKKLRWLYGQRIESKTADQRKIFPHQSFMTNNFVIYKHVLQATPFFELLSGYGHEDTLLGLELKEKKIEVQHIENPVLNGEIELNCHFLTKTNDGIKNLILILESYSNPGILIENVKLLKVYKAIQQKRLGLLLNIITVLSPLLKLILTSFLQNETLFNFYKLLIFE
ncbi:MAG: glycosyltransferase, partial [Lacibacter sp.]